MPTSQRPCKYHGVSSAAAAAAAAAAVSEDYAETLAKQKRMPSVGVIAPVRTTRRRLVLGLSACMRAYALQLL